VVEAERLYLDDDMAGFGLRLRDILANEAIESPVFFENDGTHGERSPI
jgi:hypothetical protein